MTKQREGRDLEIYLHLTQRNAPHATTWDQYVLLNANIGQDWVQVQPSDIDEEDNGQPRPILRPARIRERNREAERSYAYGPENDPQYWLTSRFPYNAWASNQDRSFIRRWTARNEYMLSVVASQYSPYEDIAQRESNIRGQGILRGNDANPDPHSQSQLKQLPWTLPWMQPQWHPVSYPYGDGAQVFDPVSVDGNANDEESEGDQIVPDDQDLVNGISYVDWDQYVELVAVYNQSNLYARPGWIDDRTSIFSMQWSRPKDPWQYVTYDTQQDLSATTNGEYDEEVQQSGNAADDDPEWYLYEPIDELDNYNAIERGWVDITAIDLDRVEYVKIDAEYADVDGELEKIRQTSIDGASQTFGEYFEQLSFDEHNEIENDSAPSEHHDQEDVISNQPTSFESYYSYWGSGASSMPGMIASGEMWTTDWQNRPIRPGQTWWTDQGGLPADKLGGISNAGNVQQTAL